MNTKRCVLTWMLTLVLSLLGCQGAGGPPGPPGVSAGNITGTVTNSLTSGPVANVTIVIDPQVTGANVTTGSGGNYSVELPVGIYIFTFKKTNYSAQTQTVSVVAGKSLTKNVQLKPVAPVVITIKGAPAASPGSTTILTSSVDVLDGSTVSSYQWSQLSGVSAAINDPSRTATQVILSDLAAYKNELLSQTRPLERFGIQPINPTVLDNTETATFQVTVKTTSGSYKASTNIQTILPYAVSPDIRNVPVGVPLLFHGKTQNAYDWSVVAPPGSKSVLGDETTQNPTFTPDVSGTYILAERVSSANITFYAGTWQGDISGIDVNGNPLSVRCTTCHNNVTAPGKFITWKDTGHARIFTENINTNAHYGEDCFACHTVGFDKSAKNNGVDDATDYAAFLKSGILGNPSPDNWSKVLTEFPSMVSLTNVQCENCHGPNNQSALHPNDTPGTARTSLSADLCAICHGELLRHGRFQQWQESGHSNFTLAIDEGAVENRGTTAAHCGRCHSAQGFLAWISQGDLTKFIQGANGNATVAELKALGMMLDEVQPETCAVCHDPHSEGATSGEPNQASVRISNSTGTLPAGFAVDNAGRGAICMVCHNTRNGLHNNAHSPLNYSTPHSPAQTDVLMGENAYLVSIDQRSPHGFIQDTCARCHMEVTPPPPLLSYNQTGTNHSFKASLDICASCHSSAFNGPAFQASTEQKIEELASNIGVYLISKLPDKVTVRDSTPHTYNGTAFSIKSEPVTIDKTNIISAVPFDSSGQQAFTVTFKNPVTFSYKPSTGGFHTLTLQQAQVQLADFTTDGKTPVITTADILVMVDWNYFLLQGDGSKGVHNPEFTQIVLEASLAALR